MATLWEKLKFWKKKTMMLEENVDFRFVDFKDSDITGVELLVDEFNGVVYHYTNAAVAEENGQARLKFGYVLVHPAEHDIDELQQNPRLHEIMGDLLTYIITMKLEHNETRNDNNKELNIQ